MSSLDQPVFHAINLDHLAFAGCCWLGVSVELCFGQLFAVEIPILAAISILNCRTIFAVALAVEIPILVATTPLNCWTIFTVQFAVEIPSLVAISTLNCWTIFAVQFAVEKPLLAAVIVNIYFVSFHD